MDRREFLAVTTTALGTTSVAGCVSNQPSANDSGGGTSTESPPDATPTPATTEGGTPTETRHLSLGQTATIDGASVTVSSPRVRKSILTLDVHGSTFETFTGQFVVTDLTGGDLDQIEGIFRASVDGETAPINGPRGDVDPLPIAETEQTYAFPFPVQSVETAAIKWSHEEQTACWDFPASIRDALAREPAFRVTEFRLLHRDGELVLDVTVENKGDRDGLFWMQLSFDAFSGHEIIQFQVPAGESHDYTGRANGLVLQFENNGGGTFELRHPSEDGVEVLERTVSVSETPTDS